MNLQISPDIAAASCLALMRAGEQSAAQAFAPILTRLSPSQQTHSAQVLEPLIVDEERHDALLSRFAAPLPPVAADHGARRFFRRLETREPEVHLARIAGIDACSCQILSRMLAPAPRVHLSPGLANALASICRDEGRHVRTARMLALELGVGTVRLREIASTVRHSFAKLLESRAQYFEALGIDSVAMIQCIDRGR